MENVMKLGKRKIVVFFCPTFLSINLSTLTVWKECKQTILLMYRIIKKKKKKKKKKLSKINLSWMVKNALKCACRGHKFI